MNSYPKATQTWESVGREKPRNKGWNLITFSKVALLSYRCLVAAGVVVAIIVLINLDRRLMKITTKWSSMALTNSDALNHLTLEESSDNQTKHDLPKDYVVYNPKCQIPNYPEFHQDVKPFFRKYGQLSCSSKIPLTSVTRSADNIYVLQFHKQYLSKYKVSPENGVNCCYSVINTNHNNYTVDICKQFDTNVTLPTADGVYVTCQFENKSVYEDTHFLVPRKTSVNLKIKRYDNQNHTGDEPLSVMILGLDAVSRLNLLRSMPETVQYLEKKGWYGLKGYHKIDKNTLYNLIGPVLTGYSIKQLRQMCWPKRGSFIDRCPWIWNVFSRKNYITAYGEDGQKSDSFEINGKFKEQPTDYFLRPLISAASKNMGRKDTTYPLCFGPKSPVDHILNFTFDFASQFANYPTFSLMWLNSPGHDNLNQPTMFDERFVSYFNTLERSGILNRTIVVFLSDHGSRLWDFRQTNMGFVEDSLPFLYVWLPNWYRTKYPKKAENLAKNKYRLTSHFDLHLSLKDVLGINTTAEGCQKCVSLFDVVPWNRGCADAGIADGSCACHPYKEIPNNSTLVKNLAVIAVKQMNKIAAEHSDYVQSGYRCAKLNFTRIFSARITTDDGPSIGHRYGVHLVISPGDSLVEAIIDQRTLEVKSMLDYTYHNPRSFCMKHQEAKAWCTCESL